MWEQGFPAWLAQLRSARASSHVSGPWKGAVGPCRHWGGFWRLVFQNSEHLGLQAARDAHPSHPSRAESASAQVWPPDSLCPTACPQRTCSFSPSRGPEALGQGPGTTSPAGAAVTATVEATPCEARGLAQPSQGQTADPWDGGQIIQWQFFGVLDFNHSSELTQNLWCQPQQAGSPGHSPHAELQQTRFWGQREGHLRFGRVDVRPPESDLGDPHKVPCHTQQAPVDIRPSLRPWESSPS